MLDGVTNAQGPHDLAIYQYNMVDGLAVCFE